MLSRRVANDQPAVEGRRVGFVGTVPEACGVCRAFAWGGWVRWLVRHAVGVTGAAAIAAGRPGTGRQCAGIRLSRREGVASGHGDAPIPAAAELAGVRRCRLHDLRHLAASLQLAAEAAARIVPRRKHRPPAA
ncbi:hypothetical protein GCM10023321_39550 [Pseudonocardia eucalypti]|uniref:Tyr recombinase domain-containing protein n=2 Tax=Pseudonocardia eucalypti TaxID=648755 RepID=A0ABP9QC40_9PSEU